MRAWGTFVAWLAATGLAIAVSWYGLRPVLDTAASDRTAPLSIEHLRGQSPVPEPSPTPPRVTPPPRTRPPASPEPTATSEPSAVRTVDGWTVVTTNDGTSAYLRTFAARGGLVAARVTEGVATLVSATPRPGYTVRAQNAGPDRLVVQFWTAAGQMSTVDIMWFEGGPWFHITEQ